MFGQPSTATLLLAFAAQAVDPAPTQASWETLQRTLPGHWYQTKGETADPARTGPGAGLDGCRAAAEGRVGADLSFRYQDGRWQVARRGGPFVDAPLGSLRMGGQVRARIGSETVFVMLPAADGAPRIHTFSGAIADENEAMFRKCPAR